jgi:tRNA A37 methylthiotransferase MiaB
MPTVYSITNGCDEGQLKSMHVQQFFLRNGFAASDSLTQADYVIFFACGLTEPKEEQSILMIKKLQKQKKSGASLIVWGCLPKISTKHLKEVYDGPSVGPKDLEYFEKILSGAAVPIEEANANSIIVKDTLGVPEITQPLPFDPVNDALIHLKKVMDRVRLPKRKWLFDSSSYFIRVAEGCMGNCTYCSERPAWGRVRSRPIEKIVKEFECGLAKGFKRFFLVAADLGSYGIDLNCDAIDLLNALVQTGGQRDFNLIINQMNPADLIKMLPRLEEVFASGKIEALGCQVESGSNRIIKLMGRNYTAESWKDCMLRINKKFPFIRLSTHLMIGFPGETEKDFSETLRLLDFPLFIDWVGFFIFSARPTVYASRMPGQVSLDTKQVRFRRLFRKYLLMYAMNVMLGNLRYLKSKIWFS